MVGLLMSEKVKIAEAICKSSDETHELEKLIADVMSDSNDTRFDDAKSIFEICIHRPDSHVFANKLYRLLSSSLDLNSCTISAILLRKSLIIRSFPDATKSTLKDFLLELVKTSVDTPRPINKELYHTVSDFAASLLLKKKCPEFLPFLFQLIASDKKMALLIGDRLAQYLGKELQELHSVLLQYLKTTAEEEGKVVPFAVWVAAIFFILCLKQTDLVNFQDLLTAMMSTMKKVLYSGNETMADVNTLELFINLAGMKSTFLRKQIVEMVKTILLMADDLSLEKETRRLAMEFVLALVQFVLTLAEVDRDEAAASELLEVLELLTVAPSFLVGQIMEWVKTMWQIVKNDSLNVGTRRLAIAFLSELAQDEEIAPWLKQNVRELFEILMNPLDHIYDDDPNEAYVYAWETSNHWNWHRKRCLDRLFIAVSRNGIFSIALEVLGAYLNAPEWQKKYGAFIVLAQSIKSCREATIENLEKVVPMVLSPFPNADPHVRRAAIEAIQQLLTHLLCFRLHEEVMRTNFEQVMQMLLSLFQDDDPVVQNASIRVIEKLARDFSKHLQVGCHLVLPALAKVMNDSPNQDVRGSAASTILVFSKYCTQDNLKEHLEGRIRSCLIVSKEVKELKRRILFPEADLWEALKMEVKQFHTRIGFTERERRLENERLSQEVDPFWKEELLEPWVQIWRNEERDFSHYLEILMSPMFAAAQLDPNVTRKRRYSRVNIIEEKAMACHVLCFCVDELTDLLVPQIDRVVYTLIPFLRWDRDPPVLPSPECYYAKAVRIAAVSAMPKILDSARKVVESSDPEDYDQAMQYVDELSDMVIGALNEASDVELDVEVRYDISDALNECVQ